MLRLFAALSLFLFGAAACGSGSEPAPADPDGQAGGPAFQKEGTLAFVRAGDTLSTLDIEIAESAAARERGLMQRLSLPAGSGMLFLFEEEASRSFWMKNTPLALDILFANADSQIVQVAKNTTPYSTERVESGAPAQFVVEVPAGYANRRGIIEGDRIRFRRAEDREDASSFGQQAEAQPGEPQPGDDAQPDSTQ